MKAKVIHTGICLLLFAMSVLAQTRVLFERLKTDYQVVEVRRTDGNVFRAEFLSEIVLLPDGRATGGFGIWELHGPDVLSLYQVSEGRNNGPFFTFKAKRLTVVPADEITINVRVGGSAPTGSVTFIIDGLNGLHLTLTAKGTQTQTDTLPQFGLIRAEPQTVLVETFTGNYTAGFENIALVFSGGSTIGSLVLSSPNGTLQKIRIKGGEIDFKNGSVSWLRGQRTEPSADPLPVLMVIANQDGPTEPCRIYDIAGTQVPAHFEAQGRITGIATDPD
ncbi:MAG TPA: hypothetical protein VHS05_05080 [Pyrinomonadaceae bacterium]|jgi:hypothetical protein|nr:hypothetical protein [Pyrinomonadaceae bacterium]